MANIQIITIKPGVDRDSVPAKYAEMVYKQKGEAASIKPAFAVYTWQEWCLKAHLWVYIQHQTVVLEDVPADQVDKTKAAIEFANNPTLTVAMIKR